MKPLRIQFTREFKRPGDTGDPLMPGYRPGEHMAMTWSVERARAEVLIPTDYGRTIRRQYPAAISMRLTLSGMQLSGVHRLTPVIWMRDGSQRTLVNLTIDVDPQHSDTIEVAVGWKIPPADYVDIAAFGLVSGSIAGTPLVLQSGSVYTLRIHDHGDQE